MRNTFFDECEDKRGTERTLINITLNRMLPTKT